MGYYQVVFISACVKREEELLPKGFTELELLGSKVNGSLLQWSFSNSAKKNIIFLVLFGL